jgi:hypothetical protein
VSYSLCIPSPALTQISRQSDHSVCFFFPPILLDGFVWPSWTCMCVLHLFRYSDYRQDYYFWESVDMIRKFLLVRIVGSWSGGVEWGRR